jgi:hypothetical protein
MRSLSIHQGRHLPELRPRRLLEVARQPTLPPGFSDLGIRISLNYVVYALIH